MDINGLVEVMHYSFKWEMIIFILYWLNTLIQLESALLQKGWAHSVSQTTQFEWEVTAATDTCVTAAQQFPPHHIRTSEFNCWIQYICYFDSPMASSVLTVSWEYVNVPTSCVWQKLCWISHETNNTVQGNDYVNGLSARHIYIQI